MTPEARLKERGIILSEVPTSLAPHVATVRHEDIVYASEPLPLLSGALTHKGKVGSGVSVEDATQAARQCAINAHSALKEELGDLSMVVRVVKLTGFVASDSNFNGQPQMLNRASELSLGVFGERGRPARTAVAVTAPPLKAPVELDLVVAMT